MMTSISNKLAALAIALAFNGVIVGGVAAMFNAQLRAAPIDSLAHVAPATPATSRFCG